MPTLRTSMVEAIPNVLQDQTVPNTLGGIGPPAPARRARPSNGILIVVGAAVAAIAALIVARAA